VGDAFPVEADVERRNSEMIEEGRVVGPGAERIEAQVGALAQFLAILGIRGDGQALSTGTLPGSEFGFRILDFAGHLVEKILARVRTGEAHETAVAVIGIDVAHGPGAQLFGVSLRPFRGTEQALLLAVPHAIYNRPPRPPALPQQGAESAGL